MCQYDRIRGEVLAEAVVFWGIETGLHHDDHHFTISRPQIQSMTDLPREVILVPLQGAAAGRRCFGASACHLGHSISSIIWLGP